ncbi:MAG: hypothetical protein LUC32_00200 [Clostridiales bacterium]|nr:hypothetical protein [Clostridiales bacterium]
MAENLIDPIYEKFTKSILRTLGDDEFYQYFMDSLSRAKNVIQFSNRHLVKTVDPTWVDMIEDTLVPMEHIISNPRNVIKEEELIVNVASAKKFGPDVVRHVAQHGNLVESYDEKTGDVRPSRVRQSLREESQEMYENRVVFTVMEHAYHFVKIRHDALFDAMHDEQGAKLRVNSTMTTSAEQVEMDYFFRINDVESALDTDEKHQDIFSRISRLYRLLGGYMNTQYAQQMSDYGRVHGHLIRTNIIKGNPDYRQVAKLYEFLQSYDEIGYSIKVVEQNPQVSEEFQRDIFHNIMFNYIILKGYLEDEKDRRVPPVKKEKRRVLKPKFIHEIIEELTEDYDLPDVEIRKVFIEELTKEQLMQEEEAERLRLVEEAEERRRQEEVERRLAEEAEEERQRKIREAEEERLRLEQEEREERERQAERERLSEERRREKMYREEITYFNRSLAGRMDERARAMQEKRVELLDFADAALMTEEEERRRAEEKKLARENRRQEKEQERRKEEFEKEMALLEEETRREQERLVREAREKEALEEKLAREFREAEERRRADRAQTREIRAELLRFKEQIPYQQRLRTKQQEELARRAAEREQAREKRRKALAAGGVK